MSIEIEDKRIVHSKLIMKLANQDKVIDKHMALYSELQGKPFSSCKMEKLPFFKDDVIVMQTYDNVAKLMIAKQNTTFSYNYHPTYQLNIKASMSFFTDMAEKIFHSLMDIIKDVSDIEVLGCLNFINIPTPSLEPSQMIFEKFLSIPTIDKNEIKLANISFSVEKEESYAVTYSLNRYEQKVFKGKPTKIQIQQAPKSSEGIQLLIDINNKPSLKNGEGTFGKHSVTNLLYFVSNIVMDIDKLFNGN